VKSLSPKYIYTMAEARPLVTVFSTTAQPTGETTLPAVFSAPIRPDVVRFVHTNMAKNKRQAYAVAPEAGHQTSAVSWGTGRAVSRIPRVPGGGTGRSGQGAFGNMCRSGRNFGVTKVWRKWNRKINVNQRRFAVASALAASAIPPLVMARGHVIDKVPEMPIVVGGDIEGTKKTAAFLKIMGALGCGGDIEKVANSKKFRAGKGKMRNRVYTMRRGPLIVFDEGENIQRAGRNIPGVELVHVERLNLLQLAPGGHMGRLIVWTEAAFKKLDTVFGNGTEAAALKKGYVLPKAPMTNSDIARIINSDEIQSVLNPARAQPKAPARKVNPLKNIAVMEKLNPYVRQMRKIEQDAQAARKAKKSERVAAARKNTARKAASAAFFKAASAEGAVTF
jgi:large subunit ribosomal protein L4e